MKRFAESDLVPISALQHLIYCERQCALIHNERLWAENRLTVEGRQLHKKTHDSKRGESRPGVRIARGLPLRSFTLGLVGQADVVEFHDAEGRTHDSEGDVPDAAETSVLPVEYKRGQPKKHDADKVQLCAQAFCLEEMLALPEPIPAGRLFYGKTRRRQDIALDPPLRKRTRDAATRLHELIRTGQTPPARYDKQKCDRCSLFRLCLPETLRPRRTAEFVFHESLDAALAER